MFDPKAIAREMISATADYVARAVDPIKQKLAALESRLESIPKGDKGDPGESIKGEKGDPGKDAPPVDPEFVLEVVRAEVAKIEIPLAEKGDKGDPGKDAPPVSLEVIQSVVNDTLPSLLADLRGEKGDPGDSVKGDKGEPGQDGKTPEDSVLRAMVSDVAAPILNAAEKTLRDRLDLVARSIKGEPGDPGRDAAHIDPLPSIDEAKSYARGTWASHRGGLILATRQTDAVKDDDLNEAGWRVIVEGLAIPPVFTQNDDLRTITATCMLTSGIKAVTEFSVPFLIERGIFKEGEVYHQGDGVTFGGSYWIVQKDKPTGKPGDGGGEFRLAVKRGRDGKDSK